MITIDSASLVGKGLHRECYTHPDDVNLCIKVAINENVKETKREKKYYEFLKNKQIAWDMLPRFYGNIETNIGQGAVFDMIRDHDGSVAKTLEYYLVSDVETEKNCGGLSESFPLLKNYLLDHEIITMTIKPKNILYQRLSDEHGKLVIVDNIGNSDFFPIANYSKCFGRKKILRKWRRFEAALLSSYPDSKVLAPIRPH
jgi:hypothetical protein